ncbi:MAG: putative permease PerM family protein [Candidatus Moranbacteria bacterium GW2011_GWA2_39_41]|nr:MAG: putative permease PerM family protein [Candidatus Moranbacteria bacterium GW2011_GWA2_39_41]
MQLKNYNVYFFFVILIGVTILAYFILKPFLVPFLIAGILAHLFASFYRMLLKITRQSKAWSSLLTCLVIALIILTPIILVSSLVVSEVQNMLDYSSQNSVSIESVADNVRYNLSALPLAKFIALERVVNQETMSNAVQSLSQNALVILQSTYQGIANIVLVTFVMFFSLFYLLIDGNKLIKKIMQLSPLRDNYENILIEKFNSITRATIKGTILIAIMQGFLGGVLFVVTGVSAPILLALLMTLSSVIPAIGAGLVWLPVGLFMMLTGNVMSGIIIILFGALVISTLDNFIRPKLVGKDTEMHPLLILFSTLGGIVLFGLAGFIVGPIIMSLFVTLWDIYYLEFRTQLKEFNK